MTAEVHTPAAAELPLLSVRDLRTYFHRRGPFGGIRSQDYVAAVDGVSFDVEAGRTLGIVGESGCGKTTLGRTLLRLVPATSGSVCYRGEDLFALSSREMRERRRDLQMIFQDLDAALNPKMRVGDLLAEALTLHRRRAKGEVSDACVALLERVNLKPEKRFALPGDLSGGEKRRVSIARVLALEPRLIVADEPLSALDVSIAAQVANLLRELQEDLGLTLLLISHDLRMVQLLAHRVIVMYLGKIVEVAPAERLSQGPRHPYSQLLWGAAAPSSRARRSGGPLADIDSELAARDRPSSGCRFRSRCPIFRRRGGPSECVDPEREPTLRSVAAEQLVACHFPED